MKMLIPSVETGQVQLQLHGWQPARRSGPGAPPAHLTADGRGLCRRGRGQLHGMNSAPGHLHITAMLPAST